MLITLAIANRGIHIYIYIHTLTNIKVTTYNYLADCLLCVCNQLALRYDTMLLACYLFAFVIYDISSNSCCCSLNSSFKPFYPGHRVVFIMSTTKVPLQEASSNITDQEENIFPTIFGKSYKAYVHFKFQTRVTTQWAKTLSNPQFLFVCLFGFLGGFFCHV